MLCSSDGLAIAATGEYDGGPYQDFTLGEDEPYPVPANAVLNGQNCTRFV
ncbi:hypothetical protein [Sphingobium sp.]|nr:hypothetical protein [Sphingobium sp.]HUD93618.1 hypothetical protein [Sphingobium sp.]